MIRDMIEGANWSPCSSVLPALTSKLTRITMHGTTVQCSKLCARCVVPNSILFLGRPGVGKTTVIREMARVLADDLHKRVVIVDTRCDTAEKDSSPPMVQQS